MNFNKVAHVERSKLLLFLLLLIVSYNMVILPALGLTITGISITAGQKLAPTLTGFALSPASVAYGASAPTITPPTSLSSGVLTYSSSNPAVATVNGTTITVVGVGTSIITATQAAAGNYTSATSTVTLTVTSAASILTGFALSPASVVYGASAPTITPPTSPSSGALTYSSSNLAVATVSGTTIALVAVGTTTITATQAVAGGYASATSTATLTVTSATPMLTGFALSPSSVSYGASAPTITPPTSASSGALTYTSSNPAVATVSGTTITLVAVGTTIMTATQAAAGNYTSGTATATLSVTIAGTCFNGGQSVSQLFPPYYSCNCIGQYYGEQCQDINPLLPL